MLGLPIYFEEDDKDFIQFKAGESNTDIALLGTGKASNGYIPALEVGDIRAFIKSLRERAVKSVGEIMEFGHILLVEFSDPAGTKMNLQVLNLLLCRRILENLHFNSAGAKQGKKAPEGLSPEQGPF